MVARSTSPKREATTRCISSRAAPSAASIARYRAVLLPVSAPKCDSRAMLRPSSPPYCFSPTVTKYSICAKASVIMMKAMPWVRSATRPTGTAINTVSTNTSSRCASPLSRPWCEAMATT